MLKAIVLIGALLAAASSGGAAARQEAPPIALGVFLPEVPYDMSAVDAFAAQIGRMPAFVVWYMPWEGTEFGDDQTSYLEEADRRGVTPLITWQPGDSSIEGIIQPEYQLRNITRGDFDAYIDGWAAGLAQFGKPVYLRFAHEMNGNWYPWGAFVNGNFPSDFVDAWRYVHDRFAAAGATNVRWVWSPNAGAPTPMEDLFPGDDYVDWVALDGLNWGAGVEFPGCDCFSSWDTFEELFDAPYRTLLSLTTKPIMIAETGSSERGGDKAEWIFDTFQRQLPFRYPEVRAIAWFNQLIEPTVVDPDGNTVRVEVELDYRIDSSTAALDAFVQVVTNPYLQGTLAQAEEAAPRTLVEPAETGSEAGGGEGQTDTAPTTGFTEGAAVVTTADVNLRAAPSPEAEIITVLPLGTPLTVAGPAEAAGGYDWWPVTNPATGETGYVAAQFLAAET